MKKIRIILIGICIVIFTTLFGIFVWDGLLCYLLPWTKTNFANYQEYLELLHEHQVLGTREFIGEIPTDVVEVEYYWHRDYKEKYAAYSMVFPKEEYEKNAEDRIQPYLENYDRDTRKIIYALHEKRCGMEDLKQAGVEVDFIQNVMQKPDAQEEYYCLVAIRISAYKATCYTGVILNDTTHEIIEFSVEIPERELNEVEVPESEFSIDTIIEIVWMIKGIAEKLL